ncbi:hypothetical protein [Streptomyces sp. NPDC001389]|uniref:hypothetical protein n=1 Tax=Streptomyces sp. NPDC001389 TaxID=3364569 RepID=UPI00368014B8
MARTPRTPARLLVSAPYGHALTVEPDAVDAWVSEDRVAACSVPGLPAHAVARSPALVAAAPERA